jgi:hypothetical protein
MKLSKDTLARFKNFASINSNLLLKPGNGIETISAQKNIMASAVVTETFETEFGIYDLSEFLGALSLFNEPELTFTEKYVLIQEGSNSIKYFAADSSVLVSPTKKINFPTAEVNFTLTQEDLAMILRTSAVLRGGDLAIVGDGSKLTVVVSDKKNATSNQSVIEIGATAGTFRVNLKVENLKLVAGSYDVSISSKKISRFKAVNGELEYFIAIEADSTFE